MAIQWADSFSRYGVTTSTAAGNTYMRDGLPYLNWEQPVLVDPDPLAAAKGERAVYMRSSGGNDFYNYNYIALPTPINGVIGVNCRMWFSRMGGGEQRNCVALFMNNSGSGVGSFMAYVLTEINGAISLYKGDGTLLNSTVSPAVSTNSWNHFETKYNTATGLVQVYLNGIKRLEGTAATGTAYLLWIGARFGSTSSGGGYYKQLTIWDGTGSKNNDIMGTVVVGRKPPVGDVTLGGWLPSTGSTGYNLLAKTTPNDATFLSADDSPPAAMQYSLADLDDEVTSVKGIVAVVRARKIDGGDANLQTSLISDGDDAPGADRPITSAYTYWFDVSEIDPHTSNSWTPTSFNAATEQIDRTV